MGPSWWCCILQVETSNKKVRFSIHWMVLIVMSLHEQQGGSFSLLNGEQMSNKVGVKHQPVQIISNWSYFGLPPRFNENWFGWWWHCISIIAISCQSIYKDLKTETYFISIHFLCLQELSWNCYFFHAGLFFSQLNSFEFVRGEKSSQRTRVFTGEKITAGTNGGHTHKPTQNLLEFGSSFEKQTHQRNSQSQLVLEVPNWWSSRREWENKKTPVKSQILGCVLVGFSGFGTFFLS